jgi:hypothetical protein
MSPVCRDEIEEARPRAVTGGATSSLNALRAQLACNIVAFMK